MYWNRRAKVNSSLFQSLFLITKSSLAFQRGEKWTKCARTHFKKMTLSDFGDFELTDLFLLHRDLELDDPLSIRTTTFSPQVWGRCG